MAVEFTVSLIELKRGFRRLSVRLPDEYEAGGKFVLFNVREGGLEILAQETAEGLTAAGIHPGRASVPIPVFLALPGLCASIEGPAFDSISVPKP